jgi:hypothetical protein
MNFLLNFILAWDSVQRSRYSGSLRAGKSWVWNPSRARDYVLSKNRSYWLWVSPSLLFSGCRVSFLGVKRRGREVDHSSQRSGKVQNEWSCTSAPAVCLRDLYRENFIFVFGSQLSRRLPVFMFLGLSIDNGRFASQTYSTHITNMRFPQYIVLFFTITKNCVQNSPSLIFGKTRKFSNGSSCLNCKPTCHVTEHSPFPRGFSSAAQNGCQGISINRRTLSGNKCISTNCNT